MNMKPVRHDVKHENSESHDRTKIRENSYLTQLADWMTHCTSFLEMASRVPQCSIFIAYESDRLVRTLAKLRDRFEDVLDSCDPISMALINDLLHEINKYQSHI